MAGIQFYAPDLLTNPILPESDSQHAIRVLRMAAGDELVAVDGRGHRLRCRIADAHPKRTLVEVVDVEDVANPWPGRLTVAVAPTKHLDRMEWMVEKLTEIGVDRIVPVLCQRSERRELKAERLRRIAVSAMKQSLKATLPVVEELTPIAKFVAEPASGRRFVAYCDDGVERRLIEPLFVPGGDATILIGPEGDFTPAEIEGAMRAGFVPVTLGDCRLRTETAALAALQTFHTLNHLASGR